MPRKVAYFAVTVPTVALLATIVLAFTRGVQLWQVVMLVVTYTVGMLTVTMGFHRHFAHLSFKTGPVLKWILAVGASASAQGPIVSWVANHRRHHAFSDKPGDTHSPNLESSFLKGLWHGHFGWMFSNEVSDVNRYARDIISDKTLLKINNLYPLWVLLGLAIPALAGALVTRTWMGALEGLLWGGLVRIFLVNNAVLAVGSICHIWGKRPFDNGDFSANNYWIALITFGEGLQSNHHAFPGAADHAVEWWEFDLSGWVIRTLELMGLVWDVKGIPARARAVARRA